MAATPRPPARPFDVDLTVVSAKHLKNVNWRNGDLKPYAIFWVDPDRRLATKSDDSGSTSPVWNERFLLPLSVFSQESIFTLEIFHSKPSETPKPLVGTLRFPLKDLVNSDDSNQLRTFKLRRPSGRPHGKIRIKLAVRERSFSDYHTAPPPSYYYSSAAAPAPSLARDCKEYSPSTYSAFLAPLPSFSPPLPSAAPPPPSVGSSSLPQPPHSYPYSGYSDPYSSYYLGYYSQPPPPSRPFIDRHSSYDGPSAPVEYDHKQKSGGKMGLGTGLAVGAVAEALGGVALEENLKYEEDKITDRKENYLAARDGYSDYRVDY